MRKAIGETVSRKCEQCGNNFETRKESQRFCSADCRTDHHNDWKHRAMEHYKTCPIAKEKENGNQEMSKV